MILNYIQPISAVKFEGREWWFSTIDLAVIFDTAPFLIAESFKDKKYLLKSGISTEYIDSTTLVQLFNYDPALIKALKVLTAAGAHVKSTAETILRIGLIYRAIALNQNNASQTLHYENNKFIAINTADSFGLSLPKLISKDLIKEIAGYYLKALVLLHSTDFLDLYNQVSKEYGVCLFTRDEVYAAYTAGFSDGTIDMLNLEWTNHKDWSSTLAKDIEKYSIKKHPLQDAFASVLEIPKTRLDYLLLV